MASNEGHIHWTGSASDTVSYLNQELQFTAELSNMADTTAKLDPIGTVRLRANGFSGAGIALPNTEWEAIPGTSPVLEALQDGFYPIDLIRIRQA